MPVWKAIVTTRSGLKTKVDYFWNLQEISCLITKTSRPTSESSSKKLNLSSTEPDLDQTWPGPMVNWPELDIKFHSKSCLKSPLKSPSKFTSKSSFKSPFKYPFKPPSKSIRAIISLRKVYWWVVVSGGWQTKFSVSSGPSLWSLVVLLDLTWDLTWTWPATWTWTWACQFAWLLVIETVSVFILDEYSVKDMFCQLCVYARSNAGYPDVITIIDEAQKYANIKMENK